MMHQTEIVNLEDLVPAVHMYRKYMKRWTFINAADEFTQIFTDLRIQLKSQGAMSEVFSFVDASHLIAKTNLCDERN